MGLRNTFLKGVETIFGVFEDAVHICTYNTDADNGFDAVVTTTDTNVRCIFESSKSKDVEVLTFYELIQPMDKIGLIPSVDIVNCTMSTKGYCIFGGDTYTVEAHDTDPLDVIFTVLLRKV